MNHPQDDATLPATQGSETWWHRPDRQVALLTVVMLAVGALMLAALPERTTSTLHSDAYAAIAIALIFGIFQYTVFHVVFRDHAISFSLSEIPLALTLVFISPIVAIPVRLAISIPILVGPHRNRGAKLAFNITLFVVEVMLGYTIFRGLLTVWGPGDPVLIAGVAFTTVVTAVATSILISIAISRYEGRVAERVVDELAATWWLYPVTSGLGGMTLALALLKPALVLLAALPSAGMWFVLYSYGVLNQKLRDLRTLQGFTGRVGWSLDVGVIAEGAVDEVVEHMRAVGVALVRFGVDAVHVHQRGSVPVILPTGPDDPLWIDLLGSDDVTLLDRAAMLGGGLLRADQPSHPAWVAPLRERDEVFGVLIVFEREALVTELGEAERARLTSVAEQLSMSLRRGMLHEQLEFEARHDALTGLPARTLFERHVTEVARSERDGVWAVMMLDLDRFKEVNDTLGHHSGDELLKEFSRRMALMLGPDDHLARLAGDEFAILCHRRTHGDIIETARRCVREGGRPVTLDGLEIVVTVSLGVADLTDLDSDALQPMRRADIAMYNAKWQRTGVELYRDEIDRRTPARLSMLGDLRAAIESNQLDVVFQPKLDLASGQVIGVEALVRWEHETRGVVAPTEFVRVAEDTGLIKDLTDLVLEQGISALRWFDELGLGIGLAVNLSTHDLFDARLPDRVRGYLALNGVDAASLTLEITESSLLVDAPRTRATIDELHEVGLRLAVDDFGTGYSSLSYLRRLPVQELKIDQSFVSGMLADPQDEVIVRSTVDLGHNLGLKVVAEGVESRAVLDQLAAMGCDVAQGYAIATPMSAIELVDWVTRIRSYDGPALSWVEVAI